MVTSPDSRWIATASHDGTIIVWNAERGTIMQEWLAHCGGVVSLAFSPDNQRLVSAGGVRGETLVVWDFQIRAGNGVGRVAVLASIDTEKRGDTVVVTCAWSPDGTLIASASKNGAIQVWDAFKDRTFQLHAGALLPADNPESQSHHIGSLQWSPNSRYLAWTHTTFEDEGNDHEWVIWSPLTGEPPKRFPSHPTRSKPFSIHALAFNPESDCIATAINEVVRLGASKKGGGSEGSEDGQPPTVRPRSGDRAEVDG